MNITSSVSRRERILFVSVMILITLSILYQFIVEPLYRKFVDLQQELSTKQVQLMKSLRLLEEKEDVTKEFQRYSQLLKTKRTEEEEMAFVLGEIEKIGKQAGVYLSDVKPQRIKDWEYYRQLLVEIKFEATMDTLTQFIYNIQSSPFLLKVKRLNINSKSADSVLQGIVQVSKVSIS